MILLDEMLERKEQKRAFNLFQSFFNGHDIYLTIKISSHVTSLTFSYEIFYI